MNMDDIRKLLSSTMLLSLDRIIAPKLAKLCYFLGLAGIVLWAFDHFYVTFSYSFGAGLWGLLEIVVFGLLALVALRIFCEAVIVFFRVHSREAAAASHSRTEPVNLVDELRDAIEDLAAGTDEETGSAAQAKPDAPSAGSKPAGKRRPVTRRTAKRSPKPDAPPPTADGKP